MLGINHFRAHVLRHSSAALAINKPELAKAIISVKQNRLQNAPYLKKDLDSRAIAQKERKYESVLKQCETQIKVNTLVKEMKNGPLTSETASEVLVVLLEKLQNNEEFTKSEGIFRLSPSSSEFKKTSLTDVLAKTDDLISKNNGADLIASKIKKEVLPAILDKTACATLAQFSVQFSTQQQKPSSDELPDALNALLAFFKESIIVNHAHNKMDAEACASILAMVTSQNLDMPPQAIQAMVLNMSKMYEALLRD
ncbi:hypothetical protein G7083_07360 [Vibrio sp. HDW18]|uniref:hypothetical protein n=1 Tax=Vibrio sp. HDW18 TaxID=2714948 RepID=UPI00140955C0|nr:hypothetical protein [Vibrio sp. HDW18]QIL85689.1 hypothetical protein G7083_07360 [Vibrio sp. HDW18]